MADYNNYFTQKTKNDEGEVNLLAKQPYNHK